MKTSFKFLQQLFQMASEAQQINRKTRLQVPKLAVLHFLSNRTRTAANHHNNGLTQQGDSETTTRGRSDYRNESFTDVTKVSFYDFMVLTSNLQESVSSEPDRAEV